MQFWILSLLLLSLAWNVSAQVVEATPLPKRSGPSGEPLFAPLSGEQTGLTFAYAWDPPKKYEHEMVNGVTGGGVCLGDYDGDGLTDVFLTQPFKGNRLYKNLGDWKFRDVTAEAGLTKEHLWGTGASFADIDHDGDLDLFVCGYDCEDRLYRNDGKGTFTEIGAQAGVANQGAAVMVAFADYDLDGDLDAYLCRNHIDFAETPIWKYTKDARGRPIVPDALKGIAKPLYRPDIQDGKLIPAGESDILYRNNGDGTFTDVSAQAGIHDEDFGLSATWWDYDHDGDPDLYNANDFFGSDHLYRNNGDGTFTDVAAFALPHTPWFSMGSDVADLNNDGLLDFMASDMQGTTHFKQKVSMGDMQGWFLETAVPRQYMRNALYINTGQLRFQEAAFLAGVDATDWTWSLKFADLDSDGRQDLFVTNGAERYWDHSDIMGLARGAQRLNTPELKDVWMNAEVRADPNLAYRNLGDLKFEDVSAEWGLGAAEVSYGAGFGDLDNDGDLDLIVNSFEKAVSVYRNDSHSNELASITLKGQGIGAMLRVRIDGEVRQTLYHTLTRGYMSANDDRIHIGLGAVREFDLEIDWPSGKRQILKDLKAGNHYTVKEEGEKAPATTVSPTMFVVSPALKDAKQTEKPFDDFEREPLLPNRLSQLGPGMAWADVDGDGDDDLYLGGSAGNPGVLYQTLKAGFQAMETPAFAQDAASEDMAALFLDADADGDSDLVVVSGGVEHPHGSAALQDRLYVNDGKGGFTKAPKGVLPDLAFSGSAAAAADFDRDGDLDVFIGGRIIPGSYPESPPSVLLRNDGGRFVAVAESAATQAQRVTGALWSDMNNDGWLDLFVTTEWGPVEVYRNDRGRLTSHTEEAGIANQLGWWNGIAGADIDRDGDMDYAVMNVGLNTKYHASPEKPAQLFYGDMDGSGRKQLVEAKVSSKGAYPVRGKSCSQAAMPVIRERFPTFESFAKASLTEIYGQPVLDQAEVYQANTLASGILINDGQGRFRFQALPRIAQIAPGCGLALADIDGDGNVDLYIGQNFYGPQPETGRMDGGVSQLLLGNGKGAFSPVRADASGLFVPGDATSLGTVDLNQDGWCDFVVASNNGPAFTFIRVPQQTEHVPLALRFVGKKGNPTAIGARVTLTLSDGTQQTSEVSGGHGYLSQNPGMLFFGIPSGTTAQTLQVRWPGGKTSRMDLTKVSGRRLQIADPS